MPASLRNFALGDASPFRNGSPLAPQLAATTEDLDHDRYVLPGHLLLPGNKRANEIQLQPSLAKRRHQFSRGRVDSDPASVQFGTSTLASNFFESAMLAQVRSLVPFPTASDTAALQPPLDSIDTLVTHSEVQATGSLSDDTTDSLRSDSTGPVGTMMYSTPASSVSTRVSCRSCSSDFSNVSAMERHERTIHVDSTAPKAFTCSDCPKTFDRKDVQQRHLLTHNRSGYVPCPGCGKPFRSDYLRVHLNAPRHYKCLLASQSDSANGVPTTEELSPPKAVESARSPLPGISNMPVITALEKKGGYGPTSDARPPSSERPNIRINNVHVLNDADRALGSREGIVSSSPIPIPGATPIPIAGRRIRTDFAALTSVSFTTDINAKDNTRTRAHRVSSNPRGDVLGAGGPLLIPDSPPPEPYDNSRAFFGAIEDADMTLADLPEEDQVKVRTEVVQWRELVERSRKSKKKLSSIELQVRYVLQHDREDTWAAETLHDWTCSLCNRYMHGTQKLAEHVQSHALNPPNPRFPCDDCGIRFVYHKDLRWHRCSTGDNTQSDCYPQRPVGSGDWVQDMMRSKFLSDLRTWERYQFYEYLEKAATFLELQQRSKICSDQDLRVKERATATVCRKNLLSTFALGSLRATHSCATYARKTSKLDHIGLIDAFGALSTTNIVHRATPYVHVCETYRTAFEEAWTDRRHGLGHLPTLDCGKCSEWRVDKYVRQPVRERVAKRQENLLTVDDFLF